MPTTTTPRIRYVRNRTLEGSRAEGHTPKPKDLDSWVRWNVLDGDDFLGTISATRTGGWWIDGAGGSDEETYLTRTLASAVLFAPSASKPNGKRPKAEAAEPGKPEVKKATTVRTTSAASTALRRVAELLGGSVVRNKITFTDSVGLASHIEGKSAGVTLARCILQAHAAKKVGGLGMTYGAIGEALRLTRAPVKGLASHETSMIQRIIHSA